MSDESAVPVKPTIRPAAATILLRDDPLRVLLVRRASSGFLPSALVFPGGAVDADDASQYWSPYIVGDAAFSRADRALRIAACRELWEETRLALPPHDVASFDGTYRDGLAASRYPLNLKQLTPFARWITPERVSRRYDTVFFLAPFEGRADAVCDGAEIVSAEWLTPRDAITRGATGDRALLFSTLALLHRLLPAQTAAEAITAAKAQPIITVTPQRIDDDTGTWITIPDTIGYPLHRWRVPQDFRPA